MQEINLAVLPLSESQLETKIKTWFRDVLAEIKSAEAVAPAPEQVGNDLVKVGEIAQITGYKVGYIYELANRHEIPFHRIGRSLRFSKREIDSWIRTGRNEIKDKIEAVAIDYVMAKSNKKGLHAGKKIKQAKKDK